MVLVQNKEGLEPCDNFVDKRVMAQISLFLFLKNMERISHA
jgi:hypothetical protein